MAITEAPDPVSIIHPAASIAALESAVISIDVCLSHPAVWIANSPNTPIQAAKRSRASEKEL